jgi:HK97 family phage portal protein
MNDIEERNTDLYFEKNGNNVLDLSKATPFDINELPAAILRMSNGHPDFTSVYKRSDLLRRTANQHTWTRASVMAIGKAAIGGGWGFVRHPIFSEGVSDSQIKNMNKTLSPIYQFFYGAEKDWRYIQDAQTPSSKMLYTIGSMVLYGQASWEIIRDKTGKPIRFDVLPGVVYPNIDEKGKFMNPAYLYRAWNSETVIKYKSPLDIVYFCWPGVDNSIYGSTELSALADTTIPSDLYAAIAYKSHFENMNTPYNGVWVIGQQTSDEDVNKFLQLLSRRYTGAKNFGRNPLAIRGDVEFKETTSLSEEDAPYLEGRKYNQAEISAVTGVSSAKLGLTDNATRTNYRELRRDFWENTLRPLFNIVEETVYEQVMVREFNIREFMLQFHNPDFSTELEKSTILSRNVQAGIYSPDEARQELGKSPRNDEWGKKFVIPPGMIPKEDEENKPAEEGKPFEGQSEEKPEGGSKRSKNMKRPHDEPRTSPKNESEKSLDYENIISELQAWKRFSIRVAKGDRKNRQFEAQYIPLYTWNLIETEIQNTTNIEEIKEFFDDIIQQLDNM